MKEPVLTEDGKQLQYEKPFWIVFTANHPSDIGTRFERTLYKPFEATIHFGAGINTFGTKMFSTKRLAEEWIISNKP